eukprot:CAMPEP_0117074712 /NCGR_PEP_ID=MMETSP0472-20121206/52644_1 /TAXON_ID=693140 ORGANISM="Tiarina fusus, Strain LIS" /NCGR_SAMPLE_ID=MMETSP0472 /ASSEMBLY_ACC=CAM_ASM_000603 /LENGTH=691 /DNA_ID=CAMNT_0004799859 /DNA_START=149 /DNA_END=2225 /DNA_ORIENTATION=-
MVAETTSKDDAVVAKASSKEKNLTKRQRRKQPNDKHKWPQHPKIQSMDVRQKAYIRVAGLGSSSKKKEVIDPKLDLMSPEVKFGRLLGGTDQRKRHAAVNKLKLYLKARCDINNENGGISEIDLMKLWKGLWHTLFMADKVVVQDELSKRLAELLWCVAGTEEEDEYAGQAYLEMCEADEGQEESDDDDDDVIMEEIENTLGAQNDDDSDEQQEEEEDDDDANPQKSGSDDDEGDHIMNAAHGDMDADEEDIDESEIPHCRGAHLASLFIRVFFRTVRREWGNMDKYRVDKFYTLIRLYMHEIFKYMASRHWNLGIIRLFNDAMFEEILSKTPNGLRYHLVDVALDELAKVNSNAPMPLTEATILDTLEPYFAMCQTGGGDDTVQGRVMEKILERFLQEYSFVSDRAVEEREAGTQEKSLVFDQVHVESVAQFIFELASDPETKDQYRKSLYDMHKTYSRRLKKVGTDVELLNEPVEEGENEDYGEGEEAEMEMEQEDKHDAEEDTEVEPVEETVETSTKEEEKLDQKKKRKRKATKEAKEEEPIEAKKREKKKSKRKSERKLEADSETQLLSPTTNAEEDDEEVTISLSEQKQAEVKSKKGKKKKAKAEEEKKQKEQAESKAERKERRVQWERVNKSKSYKASMKALVTKELPKTSKASPEKGILLNKGKGKVKVSKGGRNNRKRAVNYF